MTALRQILFLLFLVLSQPYGRTQTYSNGNDIVGIWSVPFSYKHDGKICKGRCFLDIVSTDNRLRLIETLKIGDRPYAFFARYDGTWSYDGTSLRMSLSNDTKPMFAREIRNELITAGADASYVEELESVYASSLPSVGKIGLSGQMIVRELGSHKLVLASSATGKALALQRESSLPKVAMFKFSRSEAMEAKLAGSWSRKLNEGLHTINFDPITRKLKNVLSLNEYPEAKAEYFMAWQASNGSIQLKFIDPTIHLTQYDEEISVPSDVKYIFTQAIQVFKGQAAISQVFGIAVDVSDNRLTMSYPDGKKTVWDKVSSTVISGEKNNMQVKQTSTYVSNIAQTDVSMCTNNKSNNAREEQSVPSTEKKLQEEIYSQLAEMPKFPGGDAALLSTINSLIKYPPAAAENFITGRVVVKFVVHSDGSIGEVVLIRPKDPDLDNEAIRIVKQLPNFEPGRMNGTPVAAWYVLPIEFKL